MAAQFAWVEPTNFGGVDEWLILSLVDRGITAIPHANRPLELLFSLPARYAPASLWSYYWMHVIYLAGAGGAVFLCCRRLLAEPVALLAGAFAACWAPLDFQRLNVVQPYAGFLFGACLAVLLLVESWSRRRPLLFGLAALLAFACVRAYEASGGLLIGAPLLLPWVGKPPPRAWTWVLAWEAVLAAALLLAAGPLLFPTGDLAYQQHLVGGIDAHPLRLLERLARQYWFHLFPLVLAPRNLALPAAAVTATVFGLCFWLANRGALEAHAERRRLLGRTALGLALAGLGYGAFVLGGVLEPTRAQFFSAPGIGLFLASAIALLASFLPSRARRPALGLAGAWVVAMGASQTVALQSFWDRISVHAQQTRLLRRLVEAAPRLEPNTFVILVDEAQVFPATIPFRHALSYLYPGEATGYAWGKSDLLFDMRFATDGVVSEPWPVVRRAWHAPVTFHRFDELLVLRQPAGGELQLLAEWPAGVLPPLPEGARYRPLDRIRRGSEPRQRGMLRGTFGP